MRVNISVQADLKARMDDARNEATNWSQVACRAFEVELVAIATKKVGKNMNDVIQRLRASKLRDQERADVAGSSAGRDWAMHRAEYAVLKRLSEENDNFETNGLEWDCNALVRVVMSGDDWDHGDRVKVLAELGVGDDEADGFVIGALEIFNEVGDQL